MPERNSYLHFCLLHEIEAQNGVSKTDTLQKEVFRHSAKTLKTQKTRAKQTFPSPAPQTK